MSNKEFVSWYLETYKDDRQKYENENKRQTHTSFEFIPFENPSYVMVNIEYEKYGSCLTQSLYVVKTKKCILFHKDYPYSEKYKGYMSYMRYLENDCESRCFVYNSIDIRFYLKNMELDEHLQNLLPDSIVCIKDIIMSYFICDLSPKSPEVSANPYLV